MTGANHQPLNQEELARLREEYRANNACVKAIEEAIRQGFDGAYLKKDCARKVVEEFGSQRVGRVLAATVQSLSWDGRLSLKTLKWLNSKDFPPKDKNDDRIDKITSHPAVLDGFIGQYLDIVREIELKSIREKQNCSPKMTM